MKSLEHYPTVFHGVGTNSLRIQLPDTGDMEEYWFLERMKSYNYEATPISDGAYYVSKYRRDFVMGLLKSLYSGIWEIRQYKYTETVNRTIPCSESCRSAYGTLCECTCGGEFHAGGGDWNLNCGKMIITDKIQTINRWHPGWDADFGSSYLSD